MKISYYTVRENLDRNRGYGNAGFQIVTSLQKLGNKVTFDDFTAPISLNFAMPLQYNFWPSQYKIGYTPWESTKVPARWLETFNACDEVWATSEWVRDIYADLGVTKPLYVYEHGLDPVYAPVERKVDDKIRFLHIGEPALRKGGQMAFDAFRDAFGDRDDVHLTVKAFGTSYIGCWNGKFAQNLRDQFKNVTVIKDTMLTQELLALYASHHVMVYPSYGEGFGFIPLQALGTGMPTICTAEWAPYRNFLGDLALDGKHAHSPWFYHPGDVVHPDYDMLVDLYRYAADNVDTLMKGSYLQAPAVHDRFNWLELTEKAFKHLTEKGF